MTSIQATEDFVFWSQLPQRIGDHSKFGSLPWSEAGQIEFMRGVPISADSYEIPDTCLPPGRQKRLGERTIHIVDADGLLISSTTPNGQTLRKCLVALALPAMSHRGIRLKKPSSWLQLTPYILRMARWVLSNRPASATLWSHLDTASWQNLLDDLGTAPRTRPRFEDMIALLSEWGSRGLIADYPTAAFDMLSPELLGAVEISPEERAKVHSKVREQDNTYLPFDDAFVSAFVSKCIWFQENLADQLIECWAGILEIKRDWDAKGKGRFDHLNASRRAYLADFKWTDRSGATLRELPWPITLTEGTRKQPVTSSAWPPKDMFGFNMAVGLLQAMNFSLLAFCTGARSGEVLSASETSLDADGGRFIARTFKLARDPAGKQRDWPLHPTAARALELQIKLADVAKSGDGDHIWVMQVRGDVPAGSEVKSLLGPLKKSVQILNVSELCNGSFHPHRWRHTVARLVALSVTSSPHVLMDLFGHHNVEMTLRYMLSDPQIAEDSVRTAKEAAAAMSDEALQEVLKGTAGGPAAITLSSGLDRMGMTVAETEYGSDNMKNFIEAMTFEGQNWELVRPGVICTKSPGEFGPCTQGRGSPDPGSCRTTCDHRLETDRARRDCEVAINALLAELDDAVKEGAEMLCVNLKGQIRSNLHRWPDVRERVLAANAVANRIWSETPA